MAKTLKILHNKNNNNQLSAAVVRNGPINKAEKSRTAVPQLLTTACFLVIVAPRRQWKQKANTKKNKEHC